MTVGSHVRSLDELEKFTAHPSLEILELKPDHLRRRSAIDLYTYSMEGFKENHQMCEKIRTMAGDKRIQVHLPYEEYLDPTIEIGLSQIVQEHRPMLLDRFEMMGRMYENFGIGATVNMHPPAYGLVGKQNFSIERAIKTGTALLKEASEIADRYGYQLTIENIVLPKEIGSAHLGYEIKHLDALREGTDVGLTIDTGHAKLAGLSADELMALDGITNLHLHSNPGIVKSDTFKDDAHNQAYPETLDGWDVYLGTAGRLGIPVILEINHLAQQSDEAITEYASFIAHEINTYKSM